VIIVHNWVPRFEIYTNCSVLSMDFTLNLVWIVVSWANNIILYGSTTIALSLKFNFEVLIASHVINFRKEQKAELKSDLTLNSLYLSKTPGLTIKPPAR